MRLAHTEEVARRQARPGPEAGVPFLFRQKRETNERRPRTTIGQSAGEGRDLECQRYSLAPTSDNTQIYEGTNQIQRMVMARQLLK
jgi:alkylation response protein AidB-like acyl-CoA dehydrogenase